MFNRIALPCLIVAASTFAIATIRNYSSKALRSNEIFRQLGQLNVEWELLWNNVSTKDDDTVLACWKKLSERQFAVVERAPLDLPLSPSLARKSQQEAYEYWSEFALSHTSSATALVPGRVPQRSCNHLPSLIGNNAERACPQRRRQALGSYACL